MRIIENQTITTISHTSVPCHSSAGDLHDASKYDQILNSCDTTGDEITPVLTHRPPTVCNKHPEHEAGEEIRIVVIEHVVDYLNVNKMGIGNKIVRYDVREA